MFRATKTDYLNVSWVTLTNFSLPFFINLQTLSFIWIFNTIFFTEKILRKCLTWRRLTVGGRRNDQSLIICITFLWLIDKSETLVNGNWCKFVWFNFPLQLNSADAKSYQMYFVSHHLLKIQMFSRSAIRIQQVIHTGTLV